MRKVTIFQVLIDIHQNNSLMQGINYGLRVFKYNIDESESSTMKSLVIFDSVFGNTEKVACAIGEALESQALSVNTVTPKDIQGIGLLIVGSPTRGFRPTKAITDFIRHLSEKELKGVEVAAFDTRVRITDVNSKVLTFMVNIFGYAAQPIANALMGKGGKLVAEPEGFFVEDKEGPLFIGELDRAQDWAREIISTH
jgi:flavodoxin